MPSSRAIKRIPELLNVPEDPLFEEGACRRAANTDAGAVRSKAARVRVAGNQA